MGTDTVGYTVTSEKPVFEILETIEDALKEIRAFMVDITVNPASRYAVVNFEYKDVKRSMFVFFRRDSDYEPASEPKVIYSLGYWGRSVELVSATASAMTKYGRSVYTESDVDEKWIELTPAPADTEAKQ